MRTEKEKKDAIEGLKGLRQTFPEFSFFNDNNWEAIDKAIDVIEKDITDENVIFDMDLPTGVENYALVACDWLNGEIEVDELY